MKKLLWIALLAFVFSFFSSSSVTEADTVKVGVPVKVHKKHKHHHRHWRRHHRHFHHRKIIVISP